jgi:hypothetical protein
VFVWCIFPVLVPRAKKNLANLAETGSQEKKFFRNFEAKLCSNAPLREELEPIQRQQSLILTRGGGGPRGSRGV